MLNKVILMGRLTRDPEFRQTPSGVPVCRFSIAINRQFANKQTGERETDFIDCDAWRSTAEFVSRYFSKGNMILVEGQLRNNNYTDNNGVKHYSMRVMVDNVSFCESKGSAQGGGDYAGGQQGGYSQQGYGQQGGYQQSAPQQGGWQQPAPQQHPAPQAPAQDSLNIGDIGEFEEILSDGEVPF
ncbi:MAG: single-stranded DNA-binding protein [Oscillospiraceae bacterium]|nr:single-stranded DNA-binding protein [Oscillospiraceae bacterium]MCR5306205.1 single-stranded DNA-binding protein [Oscillospiraceae bacterium]